MSQRILILLIGIAFISTLVAFFIVDYRYIKYEFIYKTKRLIPHVFDTKSTLLLNSSCSCKRDTIEIIERDETYHVLTSKKRYRLFKDIHNLGATTCNLYNTLKRGPKQKIISYSLYGKNKRYYDNLKKIVKQAKELYSKWIIRIHHDDTIHTNIICELECLKDEKNEYYDNVDFCNMNSIPFGSQAQTWNAVKYMNKMIWRWLPIGDPFVDMFISRDTDSPLSQREVDAVDDWLNEKKLFHIMRDHPSHGVEILGGMWGMASAMNRNLADKLFLIVKNEQLSRYYNIDMRGFDQDFLNYYVWKIARVNSTIHDSYTCEKFGGRGFPSRRPNNGCFIGCVDDCCEGSSHFYELPKCPLECRPAIHKNWIYC